MCSMLRVNMVGVVVELFPGRQISLQMLTKVNDDNGLLSTAM